jgi:hypothetical protein
MLREGLARGARHTAEALDWEGELDRLGANYREVCLAHSSSATKIPHQQVANLRASIG